jgi:hypothetical protein
MLTTQFSNVNCAISDGASLLERNPAIETLSGKIQMR